MQDIFRSPNISSCTGKNSELPTLYDHTHLVHLLPLVITELASLSAADIRIEAVNLGDKSSCVAQC